MDSDGEPRSPPIVLYDANLLYPFHLRNLFVQLGVNHIVAPRWTDAIHDEWIGSLCADGRATRERLLRTRDIMNRILPEANVRGYEYRIGMLTLPDPNDRHVLAAAIEAGARAIVGFNVKDFPSPALAPYGIVAQDPDVFLCAQHAADPDAIVAVLEAARTNLSRSAPSMDEFVRTLERQGLPNFAARVRRG
ncbi:MAG TPA: PIN domain-containing protein [Acetobacteraceae bacterium]|nr:PIN domain-containing protein [Acetobacteraceae bacterium]